MSIAAILGAITALGTIVGGLTYMFKQGMWIFSKSVDTKQQEANQKIQTAEQKAEQTGIPQ